MDREAVMEAEKRMTRDNALSVFKKIALGTLILLGIGFTAFAVLFALMLLL